MSQIDEPSMGWAVLKPTEIRLRFAHDGQIVTLRANLIIRPYAPLALRQLEVLEWTVQPETPPQTQEDEGGTSARPPVAT